MADFFAKGNKPINGYGGVDHGTVELWENPNPSSTMGATTLTINVPNKEYKYFQIVCSNSNSTTSRLSEVCENGKTAQITLSFYYNGFHVRTRNVGVSHSNGTLTVTVADGEQDGSSGQSSVLIPQTIYGIF